MARKTKVTKKKAGRRGGRKRGSWTLLTVDQLKQWRADGKVSRPKLAEMLGVSPTSVQNWETGHSVPMRKAQEALVALIQGGASEPAASAAVSRPASRASSNGGGTHAAQLTATGEILKAYLATSQGGKVSQEQLVRLTRSLCAALG